MSFSITPNARVTLKIRHRDDHLLVIDKPGGIVTEPGVGHEHDTLLNGLFALAAHQLQNLGDKRDFGLVHRLDKDTSGLLVAALTARAYDGLREQFESREVRKQYWAVCRGAPARETGVIRRPLAEHLERSGRYTSVRRASVSRSGRPALTAYRVLQRSVMAALIEARPVTGRLHQVRVHLDSVGASVLGDPLYGPASAREASHRLALHAHRLAFTHPITGEAVDVRSAWPRDLRSLLRRMRLERPDVVESAERSDAEAEE